MRQHNMGEGNVCQKRVDSERNVLSDQIYALGMQSELQRHP